MQLADVGSWHAMAGQTALQPWVSYASEYFVKFAMAPVRAGLTKVSQPQAIVALTLVVHLSAVADVAAHCLARRSSAEYAAASCSQLIVAGPPPDAGGSPVSPPVPEPPLPAWPPVAPPGLVNEEPPLQPTMIQTRLASDARFKFCMGMAPC